MSRKREQLIIFLLGAVPALIIGIIIGFYPLSVFHPAPPKPSTEALTNPEKKQKVLIAAQKINKGDIIAPEKIKLAERALSDLPSDIILDTGKALNMKAQVNIQPNSYITSSMLKDTKTEFKPSERVVDFEINTGLVAGLVAEGDYIDLKYIKPNGNTYVVLAKKKVQRLLDKKIIVWLTPEEEALTNKAYAEQGIKGGQLKVDQYIDEEQPASKVTYTPDKNLGIQNDLPVLPVIDAPQQTEPPVLPVTGQTELPAGGNQGGNVR